MAPTLTVNDATHAEIGHLPGGPCAGYVTGSPDIQWTASDWANHPGAVRIDQSPNATGWDATADADDYERGAVTLAELAPRYKQRMAAYKAAVRPGQREPMIYFAYSDIHTVVNALVAGGVERANLWPASWGIGIAAATQMVTSASGPFPIRAVQYVNYPYYDVSVMDESWYKTVANTAQVPPGQWLDATTWTWKDVVITGVGLDGALHEFKFNPVTGVWSRIIN